jgi:RimJ/RimL family protein N-acetyltransferase
MEGDDGPIITIRGGQVGLGPLRRDLLETLHLRWGNDLAAGLMQGAVGFATSSSNQRFYDQRTSGANIEEFLVYELETSRPIGSTGLHDIDRAQRSAEVAWNIMDYTRRRKGYGTEAALLTLDYAFTAQGLHRVMARVFEYNEPSIRLARKLGFTQFGRARQAHWAGGRYWDVLLYDMLHDEFDSPVLAREFSFLRAPGAP